MAYRQTEALLVTEPKAETQLVVNLSESGTKDKPFTGVENKKSSGGNRPHVKIYFTLAHAASQTEMCTYSLNQIMLQ